MNYKTLRLFIYFSFVFVLAGCAGVKVNKVSPREQIAEIRGDVLTIGDLSKSSQEVLRIIGQDIDVCYKTPVDCQQNLKRAIGLTEEQRLSTIAEIWLKMAMEKDKRSAAKKEIQYPEEWLEAAKYSYAYLFFSERKPSQRAFEERQTQVRDYYNYASQEAISRIYKIYQNTEKTVRDEHLFTVGDWQIQTNLYETKSPIKAPVPTELIASRTLSFSGLRNIYRRDGFGADFIAVINEEIYQNIALDKKRFFVEPSYIPVTALLKFKGANLKQVINTNRAELLLYNPYKVSDVEIAGIKIPITADFTSSYGLWLVRSNFARKAVVNLLGRQGAINHAQVFLMQPYDPNRQTIILLHGLASSPEAWINVTNEILGDKKLRDNYQIWMVYYPTNAPIAINQHDIREAITSTLNYFDPRGEATASKNITLIGHSMGGVISRLLISSSNQVLWNAFEANVNLTDKERTRARKELKNYINFTPIPQVSSAIFIAAPHKGTPVANYKIARWAANLISVPPNMLKKLANTLRIVEKKTFTIPTSIDNLSNKNPFMKASSGLPIAPNVRYHSIIANYTPKKPLLESNDGVVPYKSAHLADACSELIINSFHSVQEKPEAILEIRRILTQQLNGKIVCQMQ